MKSIVLMFLYLVGSLEAKEPFMPDTIIQYLNKENPYVYAALGKEYIYKEQVGYYLGAFDTRLSSKYDKKDYPVSNGEYTDVMLEKPIENGMEFRVGYRKAEGIQEYNNIKTGDEGEALIGIKIPVFSVAKNISQRKVNLQGATLDSVKFNFKSKDNLRQLYFQILTTYDKLLYDKANLELESELLLKAQKRAIMINKRVQVGDAADISSLEARQQIINREQRVVATKNDFFITLENFVKYLNLSQEEFTRKYTLKSIENVKEIFFDLDDSIKTAINNRPDLKVYDYEIKKNQLHVEQTELLKYPKFNVSLYGVHDFKYKNGFKISLDMEFPIRRRQYQAQYAKNSKIMKDIHNSKIKKIMDIKTELTTSINALNNILKNIKSSQEEIVLVEKLEEAENKKYILGLSNLFMVNQREIYTIEIKKKIVKYYFNYMILQHSIRKEIGQFIEMKRLAQI